MEGEIIKNYKYWSGYNDFYCDGRIMIGPNGLKLLGLTFLSINVPALVTLVIIILVKLIYNR